MLTQEVVVALLLQSKDVHTGAELHAAIARTGLVKAKLIQDLLVQMYAKCGRIERAAMVFEAMEQPDCTSYNIMLAAFARNGRLDDAKATFLCNPAKDAVSWNTLIAAVARSGHLVEACRLLEQMPIRDVVSWNSIICACGRAGRVHQALELLARMESHRVAPNSVTFLGLTNACAKLGDLGICKSVYSRIIAKNPTLDVKLGNALINMFGKCRSVSQARAVFDRLGQPDTVSWNVLMSAYVLNGYIEEAWVIFHREMPKDKRGVVSWNLMIAACTRVGLAAEALQIYFAMREQGFEADEITFLVALDACSALKDLEEGKRIHNIIRSSRIVSLKVGNALITMYGKCGSVEEGWRVFCCLKKDVVSWNAMMAALSRNGRVLEVQQLFNRMPCKDVVTWNTMITTLSQNGLPYQAIELYNSMARRVTPNAITFISVLDACAGVAAISQGQKLHRHIDHAGCGHEINVQNALINMYGKCGSVDEAEGVYDDMECRDIVSWNSLLAAYSSSGRLREAKLLFDTVPERDIITWNIMVACMTRAGRSRDALRLFALMDVEAVPADEITIIAVLTACADNAAIAAGRDIHDSACSGRCGVKVWNSLIYFYGKCKRIDEARSSFDSMEEWDLVSWTVMVGAYSASGNVEAAKACFEIMPEHDIAAWNAMLTAYIQSGCGPEALESFKSMQLRGIEANDITLTCIPEACTRPPVNPDDAKFVHASIESSAIRSDLINNAVLKMLGKCCSAARARRTFDRTLDRSVVSWNSMLIAYAYKGHLLEANKVVVDMSIEGEMPNEITFLLLLSSYSHDGQLVDAISNFMKMQHEFFIQPEAGHFCCMVDVLARSGRLLEAEQLMTTMSFRPDVQTLLALLGGCGMHGQVERGIVAGQQAWELDPHCSAPYVLTSNLYKEHNCRQRAQLPSDRKLSITLELD